MKTTRRAVRRFVALAALSGTLHASGVKAEGDHPTLQASSDAERRQRAAERLDELIRDQSRRLLSGGSSNAESTRRHRAKMLLALGEARRLELRDRWGEALERPAVVDELRRHGRVQARLERIALLAELSGNQPSLARAEQLLELARRVHGRRMQSLAGAP